MREKSLEDVFFATTYVVETDEGEFALRLDELNPAFDGFLGRSGAACWGIVTVHHPADTGSAGGIRGRQGTLELRLKSMGYAVFPARNVADDGVCAEEAGFLILQVDEADLTRVGQIFAQTAVVCGEIGAAPRLLWI